MAWRFLNRLIRIATTFIAPLLAAVAIVLIFASDFIPELKGNERLYQNILLGGIFLIVLEILLKFQEQLDEEERGTTATVFQTMREARSLLVSLISKEIRGRSAGRVSIVGGRIRSIIELLREVKDNVEFHDSDRRGRRRSGCEIEVFMMRPEFVASLALPGQVSAQDQARRNQPIVNQMKAAIDEIGRMCEEDAFRLNRVKITVSFYDEIPFGYYYLIGRDNLVFGGFLWDERTSDVIGPGAPCWHISSKADEFDAMSFWLRNRISLYSANTMAKRQVAN